MGLKPRLPPGREGGQEQGRNPPPCVPWLSSFHLCVVLNSKQPLIAKASSSELLALAEKLEQWSSEEHGAEVVVLTRREIELAGECVRTVGADVWREGR